MIYPNLFLVPPHLDAYDEYARMLSLTFALLSTVGLFGAVLGAAV